jgi:hypothetical protein
MEHVKGEIWDLIAGTFNRCLVSGMAFIIVSAVQL